MSRVTGNFLKVPEGVEVGLHDQAFSAKGKLGEGTLGIHALVSASLDDDGVRFAPVGQSKAARALTGTMRSLANNLMTGVSSGFERRLELVGVGYRAQVQGKKINLMLGFSHPVVYQLPEGVSAQTPSQTELVLNGWDKQRLGQVAAEIRALRPPEPYKGKGVRYAGERVRRKEAQKK